FLFGWAGGGPVYAVAAVASAAAVILMAAMRVRTGRMEAAAFSWDTFWAGVRFVWRKKLLLGTISLDLFAVLLGGAVALLPIYAKDILGVGPWGLGLLRSAPAAGAATMAALLAARPLQRRVGLKM